MNVEIEDLEFIVSRDYIKWEKLNNKSVLITGATGLIGSLVVKSLVYNNEYRNADTHIVILVRDINKLGTVFSEDYLKEHHITTIMGDVADSIRIDNSIDYIIHAAAPTSSRYFINNPVETIQTILNGTRNMLEIAKGKRVSGFIDLSTMEVYGTPAAGMRMTEHCAGQFDSAKVRNCYPLGKQLSENLCCAYYIEYKVPAKVLRLTQTFGPGVEKNDGRVFAEFARCAVFGKNITLKTKGETERSYLYTADAVTAILTVLLNGESGQIYTAANEKTYCSIYDMAELVAETYGIEVVIEEQDVTALGYADVLHMDLDCSKLNGLGWYANTELIDMYRRMIGSF